MATCSPQSTESESGGAQESSAPTDWQTTKGTVRERTAFLFNNSLMSDITFVLTDPDGTQVRVPAHKLVLAISSPVFEAMFYGELAEKTREIELPDTKLPYLLEFLRFLYCDEVNLTTDNAFGVLYLAQKYIVPLLADKCWEFIDKNPFAFLEPDSAATIELDNLESLLQRETLQITKELELFNAVKCWAEAKCREEDVEPTGQTIRKIIGEAVHLIRFPTILPEDFVDQVVPSGILTDKEALGVHQYFYRRTSSVEDFKFLKTYRKGITASAELHECCCQEKKPVNPVKMAPTSTGFMLGGVSTGFLGSAPTPKQTIHEKLDVTVEPRSIHLAGVRIITGSPAFGSADQVRLLDDEGTVIAIWMPGFALFTVGGTKPLPIRFPHPVLMWRSRKYTIEIEVNVKRNLNLNSDLANLVKVDDLHFIIGGSSRHISKLLFYKLS